MIHSQLVPSANPTISYMMNCIQTLNAGSFWDKLTAVWVHRGQLVTLTRCGRRGARRRSPAPW